MLENGFCEIDGIDPAQAKAKISPEKEEGSAPKRGFGASSGKNSK